jgi:hypothetical protein
MRWVVGSFYAAMLAFVGWTGGPKAAGYVVFAIVALMIMLRPAQAGRAITDWARWFFHRHDILPSG